MKYFIATDWVSASSEIGTMRKPSARVSIGLTAPTGQYGAALCYMETEIDDPTDLENHADTIILHAVDVDEQGRETPRTVPDRTTTETKLRELGMSQRNVDGLSNWSDRKRLAEEVKALVR